MKKLILIAMLLMSSMVFGNEIPPSFLKDGTITVTLKNGKSYTFSANEYMVVKRGAKKPDYHILPQPVAEQPAKSSEPKRLKHIVSGEILRSNGGLDTTTSGNQVDIRNRKQMGVGLQYQYNIYKDLFLGGRIDTNGGAGASLGIGF